MDALIQYFPPKPYSDSDVFLPQFHSDKRYSMLEEDGRFGRFHPAFATCQHGLLYAMIKRYDARSLSMKMI